MKSAYNEEVLHNLRVLKEARQWMKHGVISVEQLAVIHREHPVNFFHPNLVIRLLLFIAALVALGGVTGMLGIVVASAAEDALAVLCFIYGLISFVFLEQVFIKSNNHYKSGVNEALLYHAISFTLGGFAWMIEAKEIPVLVLCVIVFSWSAIRYLDLISTLCAVASLAGLIFYMLFKAGGAMQQLIPIAFIVLFTPIYFLAKRFRKKDETELWEDVLIVIEAAALLLIYAAGNYLVVRELSIELMGLALNEGEDIPLAFAFYVLTVLIPCAYLYFGIKQKDLVLIRTSLFVFAFSVFTFKYYYSTGHHEITFTLAGAFLLAISIWLLRFLKTPRNGYTRENLLPDKWGNENLNAFVISQTMGGNKPTSEPTVSGGGGESAGGGSSDSF